MWLIIIPILVETRQKTRIVKGEIITCSLNRKKIDIRSWQLRHAERQKLSEYRCGQ
jgi:hypothetical protein